MIAALQDGRLMASSLLIAHFLLLRRVDAHYDKLLLAIPLPGTEIRLIGVVFLLRVCVVGPCLHFSYQRHHPLTAKPQTGTFSFCLADLNGDIP